MRPLLVDGPRISLARLVDRPGFPAVHRFPCQVVQYVLRPGRVALVVQAGPAVLAASLVQVGPAVLAASVVQAGPAVLAASVVQAGPAVLAASVVQAGPAELAASVVQAGPAALAASVVQAGPAVLRARTDPRGARAAEDNASLERKVAAGLAI
jgi:hypothetical protein